MAADPVARRTAARHATAIDSAYELIEHRDAIACTWKALPDIERHVLELRFTYDLTQHEIGRRLGCSQMHVSRVLRRALRRMGMPRRSHDWGARGLLAPMSFLEHRAVLPSVLF